MYIPDNYDAWKSHDAEQQRLLERLPRCSLCDEPITEDYAYYIEGEWICCGCMESEFKREVELYE